MNSRRRPSVINSSRIIAALLSGTAVIMVLAVLAGHGMPRRGQGDAHLNPGELQQPVVLFAGDSFTAGSGAENASDGYPNLVAQVAQLDLELDAQGGTGFLADGHNTGNGDTARLLDRLAHDAQRFPRVDLLVVDAGRNDLQRPIVELAEAIARYLKTARQHWPNAAIVLIFPCFISDAPMDGYQLLRTNVENSLALVGGTLVDPVADRWYANVDTQNLLGTDRVHPNRAGHAFIAERLLTSLCQLETIPPAWSFARCLR